MIEALVVIAACAALNRFAGGGWPGHLWDEHRPGKLWGRALYPASLGVALVALLALPWPAALAGGIGYAIWRGPAWGFLVSLDHDTPGTRRPSVFEGFCLVLAQDNILAALMLRHLIAAVPAFVALSVLAEPLAVALLGPFAVLAGLAYALGWRIKRVGDWFANPLRTAEIIVGALWGAVFVALKPL